MEKKYKEGDGVYLKAIVHEADPGNGYDYTILWKDSVDGAACMLSVGEGQLFSADEPGIDWQAKYNEYNEKAEAKIRELANKLNEMAESLREAQAKAVSLNSTIKNQDSAYADVLSKNILLTEKNDELETTVSELSVLVNNLRKEIAQREEGWDNVSRNNDIAVYNLNRLCKQREVLTDRIIALEAELEAERKKNG